MFLTGLDYTVLVIYIISLLTLGFYLGRTLGQDIFLGGRSLSWWQTGFSMFSANAGPMMLIGMSSLGFSHGVVGANFEWLAWIFLLLLAMFFLPRYLSAGISTIPQYLLHRFGKNAYNFLVIYSLVSILVVWLGSALYAGGLVIAQVLGCPQIYAVALIALIATSYTAVGGFKAVVRTGIFQSVIIIVSSLILTILAFNRVIKSGGVSQHLPPDFWKLLHGSSDPEYSWLAVLAGYPVVAIYYWCADQTIVQKLLGAKDLREGQYGALFIAALKVITPLIFLLPGVICFILFSDITTADNAYITLVKQLMPEGFRGLCIAALIAALIDTVASGLNSFSTVFTLDVIAQFREMNEKGRRLAGRWVTVLASLLAIGVASIFQHSGKGLFEITQGMVSILAPPLSVVFLASVCWKRTNRAAVNTVLYGGGSICLVAGMCYLLNFPYKGCWPHFLLLSVYLFAGLFVLMVVVTLLTASSGEGAGAPPVAEGQVEALSPKVWMGWGILAAVMLIIYLILN
ncbi:SLC5 family protein [Chitinophaga flava]|uniref:Na+/glucose cotransporter n=1 Tax=Chitinophaga flava TaxID=2259036 RepID=A0A365XUT9_9BACT|nr:sodium/solute symporter [Chitinophaga flava]RBL90109.1 Na+/glucose cotransporter [Chitinophaga flava]